MQQAAAETIRAARKLEADPYAEATLLINQIPEDLLNTLKAVAAFDPSSLTPTQLYQTVRVAAALVDYRKQLGGTD